MGRLIDEPVVTTLVDGDRLVKDNPSSGSAQIDWANFKNQVEITARKGVANGYAGLDADNLVPAAHLRPAFTIEEVANAAARDALTITAGEVGKRLVRLIDTGVIYLANATGSGSSKWTTFNSMATATTAAQGVVRLATTAEARARTSAITALAPAMAAELTADLVNTRATAQGLVFDGTAGATIPNAIPAFGTGDFTILAWLRRDDATQRPIIGGGANAFTMGSRAGRQLYCGLQGGASSADTSGTFPDGKICMVSYVRGSGTGKFGFNAVEEGSTTDTRDYSVAISEFGGTGSGAARWNGYLRLCIFNYALTPAQLAARYENGGPLAADYNNANSASLITGDDSTFASNTGFWTLSGATISGGNLNIAAGNSAIRGTSLVAGRRYRTVVVATAVSGSVFVGNTSAAPQVIQALSVGTNTFEFTAGDSNAFGVFSSAGGTATIDSITLVPLGVTFAPEANAPGNGFQWRDMSGNREDVLLPVTGVSWALPDRRPNSFRQVFTYSAANDARYLGSSSHAILPVGGVLRELAVKYSAATSGSGGRFSSANTLGQWTNQQTFTAGQKRLMTLNNRLPLSPAAVNDRNIYLVPDTVAHTGTIEVEALYDITEGS